MPKPPAGFWTGWLDINCRQFYGKRFVKVNGKKLEVGNKEQADKIVEDLEKAKYRLIEVAEKEVKRYPAPPLITSTLQRSAGNRFGWSAKKTMREAQRLYEEGLITYHRTDSVNLSVVAVEKVRK